MTFFVGTRPQALTPATPRPTRFRVDEPDPTWRDRAACRDHPDPEMFHPVGNTGLALQQAEDAKDWCRRCDVADQCLRWALDSGTDHGIYGGMTEEERIALRRRVARQAAKAAR